MRNKRVEEENNYFCAQKTKTHVKDQHKRYNHQPVTSYWSGKW